MVRYIMLLILIYTIPGISQFQTDYKESASAWVFPDLDEAKIFVDDLKIEFRFSGYGVYIESDYPVVDYIPLETGEKVELTSVQWLEFSGTRVSWKKYIAPADRVQYEDLDNEGYRHWSGIEVKCTIKDQFGQLLTSRIKRPDVSDVYLTGKTKRGDYELQLDQENGKIVRVILDKGVFIQCSANPAHRFRNTGWKFCPLCGSPLIDPQTTGK